MDRRESRLGSYTKPIMVGHYWFPHTTRSAKHRHRKTHTRHDTQPVQPRTPALKLTRPHQASQ